MKLRNNLLSSIVIIISYVGEYALCVHRAFLGFVEYDGVCLSFAITALLPGACASFSGM